MPPALSALPSLPRRLRPVRLERWLAGVRRDLTALLDGLQPALCLSDGELARARVAVSSYADGLRRDALR